MPRFSKDAIALLKRVMLARADWGYSFDHLDVESIADKTGLTRQQIEKWVENFKERHLTDEARKRHLRGEEQVILLSSNPFSPFHNASD